MSPETEPPPPSRSRIWLVLWYAVIVLAVVALHMRGGLATAPFIYQGF